MKPWILLPILPLLLLHGAAAQTAGQVQVVLMGGPALTIPAGNSSLARVEIELQISGIYCQAPGTIPLKVTTTSPTDLILDRPDTVDVPYTNGPVANTPAGAPPGIASPARGMFNITVGGKATQTTHLNETFDIVAEFTGTLPSGCYSAQPPPRSQGNVTQAVHILPRPAASQSFSSSGPDEATAGKQSPASSWIAILLLLAGLSLRRK